MSTTPDTPLDTPLDAVVGRRVLVDDEVRAATLVLREGRVVDVRGPEAADDLTGTVLRAPDSAWVLPGAVDTHVHVNEPGRTAWEGFGSATRAAALGGVTTIVDMPLNSLPPTTTVAAMRLKEASTEGKLAIDVGLWGGAVPGNLADLPALWDAGVFGFKCFLAPSGVEEFPPLDADGFEAAASAIAGLGGLLIVHAEDADVLAASPAAPSRAYRDFLLSRPEQAETSAIARVVDVARRTGCRMHVLHLSSARALDLLADARAEGLPITAETCPHYLCISAEEVPDAAPAFKCCPPIRDDANRDLLWQGLLEGVIDMVVTDHSPATAAVKLAGDGDLQQAWGGIAGLQVGFTAVVHEARRRGIDPSTVSRWMARNTADLVGLHDRGRLAPGARADVVVLDEAAPLEVAATLLAHRNPITAYDGRRLDARVTHTVLAGRLLDPDRPARRGTLLHREDHR